MTEILELISDNPSQEGWYACLYTWDTYEGHFPGGLYWDGIIWRDTTPSVLHWPTVFTSQKEAEDYAYAHDPDMKG